MRKIFFTSDTHFGQQRTFDLSMRSMYFKDVEEMDLEMISRWNEVVSPYDIVYHLGDFGDFDVAKKLNGDIIMLEGNYEKKPEYSISEKQRKYFKHIWSREIAHYYDSDSKVEVREFAMVHEPENARDYNGFYLFGHIHEKQKVKKNGLNVGVDVHNFTPVSEETVEFYRNAIQNIYDDNCFINY